MIIGVDFDNVLADYTNTFGKLYKKLKGITTELPEVLDWDFGSWSITREEFNTYHKLFIKNNWTSVMPPLKDALSLLKKLKEENNVIKIITHRATNLDFNSETRNEITKQTSDWLHLYNVCYDELCFVKNKTEIFADVYLDDSPAVIAECLENRKNYIIFDYAYNRDLPGARIRNWLELEQCLQKK